MNISDEPSLRESPAQRLDLSPLIARVEAATEPDRELDAAVWAAVQGVDLTEFKSRGSAYTHGWRGSLRYPEWTGVGVFTESLDAALALAERVLPGFHVLISSCGAPQQEWRASLKGEYDFATGHPQVSISTQPIRSPALALLLALLHALQAQASESNRKDGEASDA